MRHSFRGLAGHAGQVEGVRVTATAVLVGGPLDGEIRLLPGHVAAYCAPREGGLAPLVYRRGKPLAEGYVYEFTGYR